MLGENANHGAVVQLSIFLSRCWIKKMGKAAQWFALGFAASRPLPPPLMICQIVTWMLQMNELGPISHYSFRWDHWQNCTLPCMLLHAQCQLVVLDEDIGLLSKVGFIARRDGQERLWWSLDYLFDKFKASGDEKRVLFKWIQFFKQKVSQSTFCDDPFFCQTKQTNLP